MEFREIRSTDHANFAECWQIYEHSFPYVERREIDAQRVALESSNYHFVAIVREEEVLGFVCYWLFDSAWLFVEHLAMSSSVRGGGFGTLVLDHLKSLGYPIILEIEPVVDDLTHRRQGFYERSGFVVNSHQHRQPPYRKDGEWLPLVVMSYPREIGGEEYEQFRRSQIEVVMAVTM